MSHASEEFVRALTPSSTTSGCLSGEDSTDDHLLPSSLAAEELQLALNKVDNHIKFIIYIKCYNILRKQLKRN